MKSSSIFSKFSFVPVGLLGLGLFLTQSATLSFAVDQTAAPANPSVSSDEYANDAAGAPPSPVVSEPLPDNGQSQVSAPSNNVPAENGPREMTYEDLLDYFIGPGTADAYIAGLSGQPVNQNQVASPPSAAPSSPAGAVNTTTHADQ